MFKRYAVFYTPDADLADWGACWLGWDSRTGTVARHPTIPDLDVQALTNRPRPYGLHGTLKAPFTLAAGVDQSLLAQTAADFARSHTGCDAGPFTLSFHNGFIALRPALDAPDLRHFAEHVVKAFDHLRAPLSADDLTRRRKSRLSPRQDQQLVRWGYPFIFDDFHFHITLTGRVNSRMAAQVMDVLEPQITPLLPPRFAINAITLMGEDANGMFHQIDRYALSR